jgi:hypothetical protein
MLIQADAKTKRRAYYEARKDYYKEQNKAWRDANKEHRKAHAAKKHKERKQNNPELYLWKYARARARYDKLDFDLDLACITIPQYCPYMGTAFVMGDKNAAASLDRIDSTKGYTKDNVQVICYLANKMKNNATIEQLVVFAKGVLAVHQKEVSDAHSV